MDFKKVKSRLLGMEGLLLEDELYHIVWAEIESNQMDPAAQARSIEEGAGDEGRVRSAYIKHRVRRLKEELESHNREVIRKTKMPGTCSFCGTKLGFFNTAGSLCKPCFRKVSSTKELF
jgi:ribosomal protein S14